MNAESGEIRVELDWYRTIFGASIGRAGLEVGDIDGDGLKELVSSASLGGFSPSRFWYTVGPDSNGFGQRWASLPFTASIERLVLAQLDGDAEEEVVIISDGFMLLFDGTRLTREIPIAATGVQGLVVADLDRDHGIEAAFCNEHDAWIYDLREAREKVFLAGVGCSDLAMGETDGTPGLELVVAANEIGYVLDAKTGAVEWVVPGGLGYRLTLIDADGDGIQEIVAGFVSEGIQVWRGDTRTPSWSIFETGIGALAAADVDGNGTLELLYGSAQGWNVQVLDGRTGTWKWSVVVPTHGVSRIDVGDLDRDGSPEIYFGGGFASTGPDHLYVVDSGSHSVVWTSPDTSGGFYGLASGDVDADGKAELVYSCLVSDQGAGDGLYFVHDADTKRLEFQSPEPTGTNWTGLWGIQVANADEDPALEIFVPTGRPYQGELQSRDGSSHVLQWATGLEFGVSFGSLRVADPDADGELELASGTKTESFGAGLYAQLHDSRSGNLEWRSPDLSSFFLLSPDLALLRVANIDNDGLGEVLVASEGGDLIAVDIATGSPDVATTNLKTTALATYDVDGDGKDEIYVGTQDGAVQRIDPTSGLPSLLLGPFESAIYGLTLFDIIGTAAPDYIFASGNRLLVVDGATAEAEWTSPELGLSAGRRDSLVVGNLDGDPDTEIWVNTGAGHMLMSVLRIIFSDGFESCDAEMWSADVPRVGSRHCKSDPTTYQPSR